MDRDLDDLRAQAEEHGGILVFELTKRGEGIPGILTVDPDDESGRTIMLKIGREKWLVGAGDLQALLEGLGE